MNKQKLQSAFDAIRKQANMAYAIIDTDNYGDCAACVNDELRAQFGVKSTGIYIDHWNASYPLESAKKIAIAHVITPEQAAVMIDVFQAQGYTVEPAEYNPSYAFCISEHEEIEEETENKEDNKMKYFTNCTTLDELKKEFRRLCMLHHPDRGGDTATMAAINAEYEARFPILKLAYNKTAETPTTETAESYRSEFYTQNGWKGDNYRSGQSLKEIAQLVRKFIKDQFPTYKFSVRTHYASMCQELLVEMKEAPCKIYKDYEELTQEELDELIRRANRNRVWSLDCWNAKEERAELERIWAQEGNWYRCLSDQLKATAEAVDGYVNSFNFSDCDGQIDYFHVKFYYFGCLQDNGRNVIFVPKTARIHSTPNTEKPAAAHSLLRVEINPEFDGIEVYFPSKPSEEARTALKAAGYRWHSKKKCWYARNTENHLQALRSIETGMTA